VHGVVARAVRALRVRLPAFALGVDEVANVGRVDRVERVLLLGIVERGTEGGSASEGEVVAVARVLFRVEVGQERAWLMRLFRYGACLVFPTIWL
jgi:hypothetical protein